MVAAAGGVWGKHKKFARMVQTIEQVPEETAIKVVEKVNVVLKEQVDGVKEHITQDIAPLKELISSREGEAPKQAIERAKLALSAAKCLAEDERKKKKDAEAKAKAAAQDARAKAKEAKEAAKPAAKRRRTS